MPNPLSTLRSALGEAVLAPDDPRYPAFQAGLFTPLAAAARPACVVQPENAGQVTTAARIARDAGCGVTTRGGGLSTICSATDAVVIDLKARMGGDRLEGDRARMNAGAVRSIPGGHPVRRGRGVTACTGPRARPGRRR